MGERDIVRFGVFEADLRSGELRKKGIRIRLQEKPFQILTVLLQNPGRLVTREDLKERLWPPDTYVDFEHGLNAAVNKLRDALGDSAANPRFIETLPRRGYRFTAPVQGSSPQPPPQGRILLAVLPLRNLGPNHRDDYFSDGLSEELMLRLGRRDPKKMGVIARSSVMRFKDSSLDAQGISAELSVDYLLEGSVRRDASRVRISIQLVHGEDQSVIWSEVYDRELAGVFEIQADVADHVAEALHLELVTPTPYSPQPDKPADSRAYEDYLKGWHHWNRRTAEGLRQALRSFREAVRRRPDYAEAHAGLAETWNLFVDYGLASPQEGFPQAKQAVLRSLELRPGLALPHTALAFIKHRFEWDWESAEASYRKALGVNPSHILAKQRFAEFLSQMGRHDEALETIGAARRLDPLSLIVNTMEAWLLYHARRLEEAQDQVKRILDLEARFPLALCVAGRVALLDGDLESAEYYAREAARHDPRTPFIQGALAVTLARAGYRKEAAGLLDTLRELSAKRWVSPFFAAKIHLALGERDRALTLLGDGAQERSVWMVDLKVDPELDALRDSVRFKRLCHLVGFR